MRVLLSNINIIYKDKNNNINNIKQLSKYKIKIIMMIIFKEQIKIQIIWNVLLY